MPVDRVTSAPMMDVRRPSWGQMTQATGRGILAAMVITYHGGECIKASAGDTTLVFGPISKQSKNLKPTNFGADITFVSLNHADMNGADETARGDNEPFVINGPGEYEVSGITVHGFRTVSNYPGGGGASGGGEQGNTIYLVSFDGMTLLYLGALTEPKLNTKILEDIDTIDVLFVPVGSDGVLSPAEAHKLAVQLEARAIVPIHHGDIGEKGALKHFLKESSAEDVKPTEKLTVKKKDTAVMQGQVVVLGA